MWEVGSRSLVQPRPPGRHLIGRMASPTPSPNWQACAPEPQLWDVEPTLGSAPPSPPASRALPWSPFPNPLPASRPELQSLVHRSLRQRLEKVQKALYWSAPLHMGREQEPHPSLAQLRASNSRCGTSAWCGRSGKGTS